MANKKVAETEDPVIGEPAAAPKPTGTRVQITPPNMKEIIIPIESLTQYVSNRFGPASQAEMMKGQLAGSTTRGKKQRSAKDFDAGFKDSLWVATEGWYGINASAFRQAAISACRLVGFKMTFAKLSVFIVADGISTDGTSLVRIEGEPDNFIAAVRNATGVADLRARARFREWRANVKVRFDADQFTEEDVVNLFSRIGLQVGVGAGRPDSKESAGQEWGMFSVGSAVTVVSKAA